MKPQVAKEYYDTEKYASFERFIAYFYQIDILRKLPVKKVLFIGVGDALVPEYLQKHTGLSVTTCDIDKDLNPDVVCDICKLPFENESFDVVAAFEVAEHVPFKEFPNILDEMARVSNSYVVMSLPFRNTAFEMVFKFPFIRTIFHKNMLHFTLPIPVAFPGFKIAKQHYWEIERHKTTLRKIRDVIKERFYVQKEESAKLDLYRRFYVLKKKKPLRDNYVKDYYDSNISALDEEYIYVRWFSSKASRLDYQQTKRALLTALGKKKYKTVAEIGPGDGVWTKDIVKQTESLHLYDQSHAMLNNAKKRLDKFSHISYHLGDFLAANIEKESFDLVVSVRCYEYFEDKKTALEKISSSLKKNGKLILITKNPRYFSIQGKTTKLLHTAQTNKKDLIVLLERSGFIVDAVFPATFRWKSTIFVFRWMFNVLQWLMVKTKGKFHLPWITERATESYVYIAHKEL